VKPILSRREVIGSFALSVIMAHTASATRNAAGVIKLPEPSFDGELSVEKALRTRRSAREYRAEPLTLVEVSQLLWAAQGVTDATGLRAAPSAGALYPLEIYLVAGNVTGLPPAVYRYVPGAHTVSPVADGDRRVALSRAALEQEFIAVAPAALVFCAVSRRTTAKYRERGIRYVHMEVGHAAQNVYLQAASLRLGTVVVGAFRDEQVGEVIAAASGEEPLYIMPVGRR